MRWMAGAALRGAEDKMRCAGLISLCAVILSPAIGKLGPTGGLPSWGSSPVLSGIKSVGLARARKKLLGRRPGQSR